jgi:hypothetical protein
MARPPRLINARCGMVAHTSTLNTGIGVRRLGSIAVTTEESEVTARSVRVLPGAFDLLTGAEDGPIALARDAAWPVIFDIRMTAWEEPLARNIIPEPAPAATLQSIQRDLAELKAWAGTLDPTNYDPGDLVPAFLNNL